jgi:hypothetical protein
MITDGTAYGTAIALKNLLRLLERKRVLNSAEVTSMLDASLEELRGLARNSNVIEPNAHADAAKAVGLLYLP